MAPEQQSGVVWGLAGAPVSLALFYREQSKLVEFKDADLLQGHTLGCGAGEVGAECKREGVRQQTQ